MRNAKIVVLSIELRCPKCGLEQPEDNVDDTETEEVTVFTRANPPKTSNMECISCGTQMLVPHGKIKALMGVAS